MTNQEAIKSFEKSNEQAKARLKVEKMRMDMNEVKELEFYIERDEMAIKALEQEPVFDKIFCIIYPLSIMSTPELEHKAIMQIAEMLEPLCLPESEE